MTYKQIGQSTIELKIVTYTKISGQSAQADRDRLDVNWGDGSAVEQISRTNITLVYNDIQQNTYIGTHTYPGANPIPGQPYVVSMQDPNRNDNILNINGGSSVNVAFYLQTEVFLFNPTFFGFNSSPVLLEPPIDFGIVGQVFQHTPNGYDPDGDSIAYELVSPMSDRNVVVPGYQLVTDINPGIDNQFTFDTQTGLFTWDSPQKAGEYNIAILVKSYRNGQYIGSILRDIQIKIGTALNTPPIIDIPERICVVAGSTIEFNAQTWDLDIPLQVVNFTATGGPLDPNIPSPATFNNVSGTAPISNKLGSIFRWNTVCEHIQKASWQVVFKAKDNGYAPSGPSSSLATFKVLLIDVIAPPAQNLSASVTSNSVTLQWDAPYACENSDNFLGFSVWRKENCDNFLPDTCEIGLDGKGYTQLNNALISNSSGAYYEYIDVGIQTGIPYSYRVLAEFATPIYYNGNITNYHDPVSGISSEEVCIQTKEDLPILINVDVVNTEPVNGSIIVRWMKPNPLELDTLIFQPPYKYALYQSKINEPFTNIPIFSSPDYPSLYLAKDTFYTDLNLDTKNEQYKYQLIFYSNNDTLGTTQSASSIFLEIGSSDGLNNLIWNETVPWQNSDYIIHLESPINSGNFIPLDTVQQNSYIHSGLVNGTEYCYRIESIGSYNTDYSPDTLFNHSQKSCGIPIDTIAPCPPSLDAIVKISACDQILDDANDPERLPCQGSITAPEFLFNTITWNISQDSCALDVAYFKVYFSPYCTGDFTLVYQGENLSDTSFTHAPSDSNLAGCYYITAVDSIELNGGGNEGQASALIRTDNCPFYDLPNTFTPNNDGKNDLFKPCLIYRYIREVDFKVTNRWGQVVFQTRDKAINWDGKDFRTGKDLAEGVYYYTCSIYQDCVQCESIKAIKGFIHLIRSDKN